MHQYAFPQKNRLGPAGPAAFDAEQVRPCCDAWAWSGPRAALRRNLVVKNGLHCQSLSLFGDEGLASLGASHQKLLNSHGPPQAEQRPPPIPRLSFNPITIKPLLLLATDPSPSVASSRPLAGDPRLPPRSARQHHHAPLLQERP